MNDHKYRVLIIASHPVQYASPIFRLMAQHPNLDILVAYCSLQGVEVSKDLGFGVNVVWDIPLLDGYPWIQVANQSRNPGVGSFFGLVNRELWSLIYQGKFDAVISYTGYAYASFWIAAAAAKISRTALLFTTDSHQLKPRDRNKWKTYLKKILLPRIFNLADTVIVSSSGGVSYINSLGIPKERIKLTPSVVDNIWWISQSKEVDRIAIRQQWHIPPQSHVVLFCAKLQPWKRPQDALRAFSKAKIPNSYLVFAGDGVLRAELETEVKALGLEAQVRFLGFVNQSQLPATYTSADLFVFPSEYEPFGVVVNEAMLCGCPVMVSDQVGARYDLVHHMQTGFVYPCSDVDTLAEMMRSALSNKGDLERISLSALKRLETWSPHENVEAIVHALKKIGE